MSWTFQTRRRGCWTRHPDFTPKDLVSSDEGRWENEGKATKELLLSPEPPVGTVEADRERNVVEVAKLAVPQLEVGRRSCFFSIFFKGKQLKGYIFSLLNGDTFLGLSF